VGQGRGGEVRNCQFHFVWNKIEQEKQFKKRMGERSGRKVGRKSEEGRGRISRQT